MFKSFALFLLIAVSLPVFSQSPRLATETEIIYGRKDGMALTMVKHDPVKPKGKAIIWVVSGSWFSSFRGRPGAARLKSLTDKGYTVFEVIHGSQPRYNIEDALSDLRRAVRFIRYHAADYQIDPAKIGMSGASAGGHLSLLVGLMDDVIHKTAADPVDRESSKVQALAVFYPPTDFTNWAGFADAFMQKGLLERSNIVGAFDLRNWDSTRRYYSSITDTSLLRKRVAHISPAKHVSADDAPVFIYHGDADKVVPLQQSTWIVEKLKAVKVPVELKVKSGGEHGWTGQWEELDIFASWFDKYLK